MRVLIVHNPKAGDTTHGRDWLLRTVEAHGHDARYFASNDDGWKAAVDSAEVIAVAGGDGSVDEVARFVAGRRVLLAVLPFGTANNVATKLGLVDVPVERLIASWSCGERQRFDIGVARGEHGTVRFVESVGIGLLAEGMFEIDTGTARWVNNLDSSQARMAAALELFQRELQRCRPRHVTLTIDDDDVSGDYLMVEVLNFGAAGPNLHLSPAAEAADGWLDVVLVGEKVRRELVRLLPRAREIPGCLHELPVRRGRRVTLRCHDAVVHVDDRLWRLSSPEVGRELELTIEEGALTFLVPRRQP